MIKNPQIIMMIASKAVSISITKLSPNPMPVVMIKSGFPRCGMLQLPPFKVQAEKKHLNHIG